MRFVCLSCGVSTKSPRRGGVRNAGFVAFRATGAEIRNFKVFTGRKMAGKKGKWPKLGKLRKNHTINPTEIMLLRATNNLLNIKTLAKMDQSTNFYFLLFFVHVLLFCLYFCYWRRCMRQRCTNGQDSEIYIQEITFTLLLMFIAAHDH